MNAHIVRQFVTNRSRVTIVFLASLTFLVVSCKKSSEKGESANLVRIVTALRMADNEHKQAPLDQLRAFPCQSADVCAARDACVKAFGHHVRGLRLGARLRGQLADAGPARTEEAAGDDTALLLEMNLEVEEGRKAMPTCDERVASLRRKHRL